MKSIARILILGLGLSLMAACNREDATKPAERETGSAKLYLPALPAHYLAKKSAAAGQAEAKFRLSIYVEGKLFKQASWGLDSASGTSSILVTDIPSGPNRVFFGELLLNDSVTHEGVDSVYIAGNKTTDVYLYLRDIRDGSAHICVVIEGMPEPLYCHSTDTTTPPPSFNLSGCWRASIMPADSMNPPVSAQLYILQMDSSLQAELIWPGGAHDTAVGFISATGWVRFRTDGGASVWSFDGLIDPTLTSIGGDYKTSARYPYAGYLTASRTYGCYDSLPPIDSLPPPIDSIPVFDSTNVSGCWLAYIINGGDTVNADLTLYQTGNSVEAVMRYWDGAADSSFGNMNDNTLTTGMRNVRQEFMIAATVDKSRSFMEGKFSDPSRHVTGMIRARRGLCRNNPPPVDTVVAPPVDTAFNPHADSSCWKASQTLDGKNYTGTFSLVKLGSQAQGLFVWTEKSVTGLWGSYSALGGLSGAMELFGVLTPSMQSRGNDRVFYKAKVDDKGIIASGSVYGVRADSTIDARRGSWKGVPTACTEAMFNRVFYPN
jgi:hypothetical protein